MNIKKVILIALLAGAQIVFLFADNKSALYDKALIGIEAKSSAYKKNSNFNVFDKAVEKDSPYFAKGYKTRVQAYSDEYVVVYMVKGKKEIIQSVMIYTEVPELPLSKYIGESKEKIKEIFPFENADSEKGITIIYNSNPNVIVTFFGTEDVVESIWINPKL